MKRLIEVNTVIIRNAVEAKNRTRPPSAPINVPVLCKKIARKTRPPNERKQVNMKNKK